MKRVPSKMRWWFLGLGAILALGVMMQQLGCGIAEEVGSSPQKGHAERAPQSSGVKRVSVVRPSKGGIARTTKMPGTMESFDWADLYAKVSGYIKEQVIRRDGKEVEVDIGTNVKRGDVLAEIDMPELVEEFHRTEAALTQAETQVVLMEAKVRTARADLDAANAAVAQAEAELKKAESYLSFRKIQYKRIKDLFDLKSIDERRVDETHEQSLAAEAAETAARAAIETARAQAVASEARVGQALADVDDAKAKVKVAKAMKSKAAVFVDYTKIISPYDGVVTKRAFHRGDFVRAADQGGNVPMFTVARTDVMRVIVPVPDRDVPYINVGDPAIVEVDPLQGEKFEGTVARFANSEDRETRTMRTEIDLKNPRNRLRDGMYGRVIITVDDGSKGMTVPSNSVVEDQGKQHSVFVVRDGKARKLPVEIGQDDGSRTEVIAGLSMEDEIVRRPSGDLVDGMPVEVERETAKAAKTDGKSGKAVAGEGSKAVAKKPGQG